MRDTPTPIKQYGNACEECIYNSLVPGLRKIISGKFPAKRPGKNRRELFCDELLNLNAA